VSDGPRERHAATGPAGSLPAMFAEISPPRLVFAALLAAAAVALLPAVPAARAATCPDGRLPSGNGYFTSLTVTKVSCKTGKRVVLAYYKCRIKHGKKARCTDKVLGYSCRELKRTQIPTEINARVSCARGARRVVHTYQQNL
jgi:hypothetical protein